VTTTTSPTAKDARDLVIERVFDAPRALVFEAWTDRQHLMQWSCPSEMTLTALEMASDIVQPGAPYRLCMTGSDGIDHWLSGVYRDVVAATRLSYTAAWEDAAGQRGHETLVTVTFEDAGTATKLTLRQAPFATDATRDANRWGWASTLDHLSSYLTGVR